MRVSIRGIQEAQRENNRQIAEMRPSGAFGRMIQFATVEAHRYAVTITHVDTGALKASHRMVVEGPIGKIFIDSAAVNPRGARPSIYGPIEHSRGGGHAFYYRTEQEAGSRIARAAAVGFIRELGR